MSIDLDHAITIREQLYMTGSIFILITIIWPIVAIIELIKNHSK